MNRIVQWGANGTLFTTTAQATVDVGTTDNRVAYVLMGNLNSATPLPDSVTIGSDTLASSQAQFTDASNFKWKLYYGVLTVTGSQLVTATMTTNDGQVWMVGVVYDGVDTGALIESYDSLGTSIPNPTWTSGAITTTTGDDCVALIVSNSNNTLTGTGGTAVLTGAGIGAGTARQVAQEAGSGSVTMSADYTTFPETQRLVTFNVPAGGGGGSPSLDDGSGWQPLEPQTNPLTVSVWG